MRLTYSLAASIAHVSLRALHACVGRSSYFERGIKYIGYSPRGLCILLTRFAQFRLSLSHNSAAVQLTGKDRTMRSPVVYGLCVQPQILFMLYEYNLEDIKDRDVHSGNSKSLSYNFWLLLAFTLYIRVSSVTFFTRDREVQPNLMTESKNTEAHRSTVLAG